MVIRMKKSTYIIIMIISFFIFHSNVSAIDVGKSQDFVGSCVASEGQEHVNITLNYQLNLSTVKCLSGGQIKIICTSTYTDAGVTVPTTHSFNCINSEESTSGVKPVNPENDTFGKICNVDENPGVMRAFKAGGVALVALKIIIPILLIILGTIDFAQAVISSDDKQISKSLMKLAQRVIAGIVIFLVPTLIEYIFDLVDSTATNKYKACYECLLDVNKCPTIPKVGGN